MELREMGLGNLDLSSINQSGNNIILGTDAKGESLTGEILRNNNGQITNIICKIASMPRSHDLNIGISRDQETGLISTIKLSQRYNNNRQWEKTFKYTIIKSAPLAKSFGFDNYWRQFANSNTMLVYYNAKTKSTLIHKSNGAEIPLGKSDVAENLQNSRARWFTLVMLGVLMVFGGSVFLMMLRRQRNNKSDGNQQKQKVNKNKR
jgi:hypothetical protein